MRENPPPGTRPFPNGGIWPDAAGVHINAHGGGLLKEGGVWYWYGEHKTAGKSGNVANVGVHVYSSPDLRAWAGRMVRYYTIAPACCGKVMGGMELMYEIREDGNV